MNSLESCVWSAADKHYMHLALDEARAAADAGDVPVGAVLVGPSEDGTEAPAVIATGRNTREVMQTALGHAEINTIHAACTARGSWRLSDCTLYVTLEPCPMCTGAILHARIGRVVCGTKDPVAGAMGSVWALHRYPVESKHTGVEYGCCEEACRELLQEFFKLQRINRQN